MRYSVLNERASDCMFMHTASGYSLPNGQIGCFSLAVSSQRHASRRPSYSAKVSHVIDVVLDVCGIRRRPPWVGGRGQIVRRVPPEGLFSVRKPRRRVVRARGGRNIVWVPQQVDTEGILRVDRKWLHVNVG